jgi:hypothetical protein
VVPPCRLLSNQASRDRRLDHLPRYCGGVLCLPSRIERIRRSDWRPQHGGCWSPTPKLTGEQPLGSEQIVKSDRTHQTEDIGPRSVLVLAGKLVGAHSNTVRPSRQNLALDSKQEFRRSAICSISATIGNRWSIFDVQMFISDQCSLAGKARVHRLKPNASTFIGRSRLWQALQPHQ